MPFCEVSKHETGRAIPASPRNGIRIYYRRYGRGNTKVLLIIGLAGTHEGWGPQVKGLAGSDAPRDDDDDDDEANGEEAAGDHGEGIEICCFDNRGMGRSSIPSKKTEYTTTIMAKDALALLDHLGWRKAHVFGHSMGAMIACKLATVAPDRISSLALLNVTGGGFQCFPKIDRQMLSLAVRFLRAKTPEERAIVDLDMHYTKEYLNETVGSTTRRKILHQEYVKGISSSGMQSSYGFEGQINACWTHGMSEKELDTIRSSGFLVLIIHGRYDIIAQVCHARKLAEKLQPAAKIMELHGAHLVSHERHEEVNESLLNLIKLSQSNTELLSWSILSRNEIADSTLTMTENKSTNCLVSTHDILAMMQIIFLYIFGFFLMAFEQAKRAVRVLKPAKVRTATPGGGFHVQTDAM